MLAGPLVLLGAGLGVLVPVITTTLLGSVDATRAGVAAGWLTTARQTGSVLGVALFGTFAHGQVVAGLRASLAVSLGLALVTAALAGALTGQGTRTILPRVWRRSSSAYASRTSASG